MLQFLRTLVFFSFLMFFLNRRFHAIGCVLTAPSRTEWRIGNDDAHILALKAVCLHRILQADVLSVLIFNKHISKADGIGFGIYLLPKQAHFRIRVHSGNRVLGC
ncbi:hypothetical protein SDC9_178356 [bioreactor metagenome]|uniref:Uncharacterized protein n=1 Tax=bioreactor metagenome TaxID=1076179 RepID=A0A645GVR8_9ZZZZ